jgi:hypothetical protein
MSKRVVLVAFLQEVWAILPADRILGLAPADATVIPNENLSYKELVLKLPL